MTSKSVLATLSIALSLGLIVTGCASSSPEVPITPSPDKSTFIYFYTEG
jgi:hypothetical protein